MYGGHTEYMHTTYDIPLSKICDRLTSVSFGYCHFNRVG